MTTTNTTDVSTLVHDASTALSQMRASIAEIVARRQNLMLTACAELSAAGVEARIVTARGREPFIAGEHGSLTITYDTFRGTTTARTSFNRTDARRDPGPFTGRSLFGGSVLYDALGTWEVLLVDNDQLLIARVETGWEERAHRKAVARLRTLAKHDDLHVRARDLHVTLMDPMGNTVHEGTVTSAHAFILNIDIEGAVPE
ncbi:hypothetical protein [Microbacterium sp. 11MF]|uniref:hypothetical protein n=1 Tax=Microbacterium sp. 11MF TaxID=1169146 RepID=UPI000373ACD8|nr:hypothetical protein [Microbacterium sp. 11MF]